MEIIITDPGDEQPGLSIIKFLWAEIEYIHLKIHIL